MPLLTFNMDDELFADGVAQSRVGGEALVLALVRVVNVIDDDLLAKALVLHLGGHQGIESTPLHCWGRATQRT